jgi:error-prone DNA polymerase
VRPFASIADFSARVPLRHEELATLAEIGALSSLPVHPGSSPGTRRAALWQAEAALRRPPGLFANLEPRDEPDSDSKDHRGDAENAEDLVGVFDQPSPRSPRLRGGSESFTASPLPEMTVRERTAADLRGTGITVGPHPVALERERLRQLGVRSAAELPRMRNGQRVRAGGLCIVRQRPGTAKGFVFLSLEDETGISNIVIDPPTFERNRRPVLCSALLVVEGRLERYDGVTSVKGDRFWSLEDALTLPSRDFR